MKEKIIYIIAGSTAIGKNNLALDFAYQKNAEIICCDPMLMYKYMDIGTAKPSIKERELIKHHLIDVITINEVSTIQYYFKLASKTIKNIEESKKNIIVVGGSFFYLKSFLQPISSEININNDVKNYVNIIEKQRGIYGLIKELNKYNPNNDYYNYIDINNPRRVSEALKRCISSNKSIKILYEEFIKLENPFKDYKKKLLLAEKDNDSMYKRIINRTNNMIEEGLIDEVNMLINMGIKNNPSASKAIGYKETIEYIENKNMNLENLKSLIIQNTFKLAKNQKKLFYNYFTKFFDDIIFINI